MTDLLVEVEQLYWACSEAVDEGPLSDWPLSFTEDGTYRLVPRSNHDRGLPLATMWCEGRAMMRDRVYALEKANFYLARRWRHVLSPVHLVDPAPSLDVGGRLATRANFVVHETVGLRPTTVLATGQYRDVVTRDDDGCLRFAERLCLNESELVPNSLVFPL